MAKLGGKIFNLSRVEIFHATGFGLLFAGFGALAKEAAAGALLVGATPWLIGLGVALGALCIISAIRIKRKQDALDKEETRATEKVREQAAGISRVPALQQETVRAETTSRFVDKYLQEAQDPQKTVSL